MNMTLSGASSHFHIPTEADDTKNWKELGLDIPQNLNFGSNMDQLVEWNVEVLLSRLAKVVVKRNKEASISRF
jgi:hypothetical protein